MRLRADDNVRPHEVGGETAWLLVMVVPRDEDELTFEDLFRSSKRSVASSVVEQLDANLISFVQQVLLSNEKMI